VATKMKKYLIPAFFLILFLFFSLWGDLLTWAADLQRTVFRDIDLCCYAEADSLREKLQMLKGTVGLKADVEKGALAVDHILSLKAEMIADEIRRIGFPVQMAETSEIANRDAYSFKGDRWISWGCAGQKCGGSGYCSASNTSWKVLMRRLFGNY
jgi:hypothetical protein